MYIKSSLPDPPKVPDCNAYEALWSRYESGEWPEDVTLHIESKSGKKRTYQEFRTRVLLAATALGGSVPDGFLGIRSESEELVAIISRSSSDYAVLVHALLRLATPFALFVPARTSSEFESALKLTKPTRIFVEDQLLSILVPVAENLGIALENIYVLGEKIGQYRTFEEMVEDSLLQAITPVPPSAATKDTLACLLFSSGTTGLLKAVKISHGNIIASLNLGVIRSDFGPSCIGSTKQRKTPVHLARAWMSFISGLHLCCFHPFAEAATCVIVTDLSLEATLEAIERYRITVARFHPFLVQELVNYPRLKDTDLSSIQAVLTGGSYFTPELLAKLAIAIPQKFYFSQGSLWNDRIVLITVLEPEPIILGETECHVLVKSVGTLFPGVEAHLLREDGSEADVDEVGELYVRSDTVALGYYNNEEATRKTFVDGWLRTGDVFRVDRNGCFFIAARVQDTFKTLTGYQVCPFEIEDTLRSEPRGLIADVVVAGVVPNARPSDGKFARAWIVLSDEGKRLGADAVIKELEVWYQERLSSHKWLHSGIAIVDEIPKSASGKALRRVLQKKYEECG